MCEYGISSKVKCQMKKEKQWLVFYHFCEKHPPRGFCQYREIHFGSSPQIVRENGCELLAGQSGVGDGLVHGIKEEQKQLVIAYAELQ